MSEGTVLKNLSDEDYLITFNRHIRIDTIGIDTVENLFKEVNKKQASRNVSFCKKHDVVLFQDIEKPGKQEYKNCYIQNLEYALKAASFEIYNNIMQIKYMAKLFCEDVRYADGNFFNDYKLNIEMFFKVYSVAVKLMSDIKKYKEYSIISNEFKTSSIRLPFSKINYSLSEFIPIQGSEHNVAFLNVINALEPYIILSYYQKEDNNSIRNLEFLSNSYYTTNKRDYLKNLIYYTLDRTQNIYFVKNKFNDLSNNAKFYLYIINRFGTSPCLDSHSCYLSKQSIKDICKVLKKEEELINEIINKLYIKL